MGFAARSAVGGSEPRDGRGSASFRRELPGNVALQAARIFCCPEQFHFRMRQHVIDMPVFLPGLRVRQAVVPGNAAGQGAAGASNIDVVSRWKRNPPQCPHSQSQVFANAEVEAVGAPARCRILLLFCTHRYRPGRVSYTSRDSCASGFTLAPAPLQDPTRRRWSGRY
jgi:hypothetical protein